MYEYVGVEHWQKTTVFNLAKWKNGLAFRNINFSEIGRPVIKIAELKSGITGQTKFTDGEYDESVCVRKGDMLFSWSGNPDTSIDVFRWEGSDGWLNQHIYKVTPREGVDEDFLFFLLRWLRPRFAEIARNKQTTGLGHVTLQDFKNMAVGLPEISEQIAIVSFVRPIQDKIELNRRINKTLEATARAIFKDWFIDFGPTRAKAEGRAPYLAAELWDMFPDAFDDEGKPAGWNKKAMGELCEVAIGGLWGKDQSGSVGLKEYFCLRGVDLQHLRELGEAQNVPLRFAKGTAIEKRYVSINDVLIASSGAGPCGRSLWVGIEDLTGQMAD